MSIVVGTRNAALLPESTRAVGSVVAPDGKHVTVFLPTAVSDRAIANIGDNGRVAIGYSSIGDHVSVQVKGRVVATRDANPDERDLIVRYIGAFAEALAMTGIPRATTRALNAWPAHAVTVEVSDIFDQTPGVKAGDRWSLARR